MILKKLVLNNFRGHRHTEINFTDEKLTVIIGANGSGKSSVLDAISICMSWIIARIKNQKGVGHYINPKEVYNGEHVGSIEAQFDAISNILIYNKAKSGYKSNQSNLEDLNAYTLSIRDEIEHSGQKTSIPVFAHYGVRRAVLDIPLRIRKEHIFDLFETYSDALDGDASFRTFFEWFRNQEDIENERFREAQEGGDFKKDRELSAVRRALEIFMPEYKGIRVSRRPLRMLVNKNGFELRIDQLSDGEKIYIALIGDLCRRLVLANPTLEDPLLGKGIVLIDELDLHLHPRWQADMAPRLMQVFPNIQFIVTTHSPLVITNVQPDSVRILEETADGLRVAETLIGYGLPISIIMKDMMGLPSELPVKVEELLQNIYKTINDNDIDKSDKLFSDLSVLTPEHPELSRIRKLMDRIKRRSNHEAN